MVEELEETMRVWRSILGALDADEEVGAKVGSGAGDRVLRKRRRRRRRSRPSGEFGTTSAG
ncbi:hypothetical protein MMC16_006623 [Acarospora aff. strigata]|nr:hypothetical protein [Acarospora aff. strigata]